MIELKKWKRADNYIGEDLSEYYVVVTQHYNSDLWEKSNFIIASERLGGENPPKVIIGHFSHWMTRWIEVLLVHESAEEEIAIATDIVNELHEYPILNEDHYDKLRAPILEQTIEEIRRDVQNDLDDGKTECRMWDIDLTLSKDEIEEKIYDVAEECVR